MPETADGGESVDGDAEEGGHGGDEAEAAADDQQRVRPVSEAERRRRRRGVSRPPAGGAGRFVRRVYRHQGEIGQVRWSIIIISFFWL